MKKILVGVKRSYGSMEKDGKKIPFDNIVLYLMDYKGGDYVEGFILPSGAIPKSGDSSNSSAMIKIKTSAFKTIVGVSPKRFIEEFAQKYIFRKIRIIGSQNDYGRFEVDEIQFSKKDCYALYDEEQRLKEDAFDDTSDDSSEPDFFDGEDPEDEIDPFGEDPADEFELDKATGEVIERAVKNGEKHASKASS